MIQNRLRQNPVSAHPIAAGLLLAGCGSSSSSSTTSVSAGGSSTPASEAASAATGDIPDNQQFLRYTNSASGVLTGLPAGLARKGSANDITFSTRTTASRWQITKGSSPTVSSVTAELKKEAANDPTLQPGQPQQVQLPSGPAIHVVYHVQGPPDPVTGKKPTMMVDRYVLANKGRVATVNEATRLRGHVDAYLKDDRELQVEFDQPESTRLGSQAATSSRASTSSPRSPRRRSTGRRSSSTTSSRSTSRDRPARSRFAASISESNAASWSRSSVPRVAARARFSPWQPRSTSPPRATSRRTAGPLAHLDEAGLASHRARGRRDRLPVRQPVAGAERTGETSRPRCALRVAPIRSEQPKRRWARSACPSVRTSAHAPSPAASSSGWRSPPRRHDGHPWCWPTNRPASSNEKNEGIVLRSLADLRDRFESTIVVVTHSDRVAAPATGWSPLQDGKMANGGGRAVTVATQRGRRSPHAKAWRSSTAAGLPG